MGPKVAAVVETPAALREGCNLLYIRCSLPGDNKFLSICMNLNCRVDIILDTAKRSMLKEADKQSAKLKAEMQNSEAAREGEAAAAAPGTSTDGTNIAATIERLNAIIEALQNVEGLAALELQDQAGAPVGVQELLAKNGTEALKPAHKYSLGSKASGAFVAF
jgi:hypothetical protein